MDDSFNLGESVQRSFDTFFDVLPSILFALLILAGGYIISKTLQRLVNKLLTQARLNEYVGKSDYSKQINKMFPDPAGSLAHLAFWVVILGVISLTVSVLGIQALTDFVGAVYSYIPNILAAILIFVAASAVSGFAGTVVKRTMGDTPTGSILMTTVPIVVMSIAFFMILDQLNIASDIVNITYTAIIGGIALGLALAFGLGGRDVAGQILDKAYSKGQENYAQAKSDLEKGRHNAKQEAKRLKQKARK